MIIFFESKEEQKDIIDVAARAIFNYGDVLKNHPDEKMSASLSKLDHALVQGAVPDDWELYFSGLKNGTMIDGKPSVNLDGSKIWRFGDPVE